MLELRVMELEHMGFVDAESLPGEPSSMRQFALATLMDDEMRIFITLDDELLGRRDDLEHRYGMNILSVFEALLLLREDDGPPN
jgi:hypothetical protein